MIALVLPAALALPLVVPPPVPPAPALASSQDPRAARNPILEGVAVQAGDGIVLLSEYERVLERALQEQRPETRDADTRLRQQILRDFALGRLEAQAGEDLGLDREMVERIRRASLSDRRREQGLEGYLESLREKGTDALSAELESEGDIYRELWRYEARGLPYGEKRRRVDRGVRPGELRECYAENREKLAPPETVQIRWLIVSSQAMGGPDAARESCEDARRRVLAGEDLALLVEERGADLRDTRGLTPFFPPAAVPDPALVAFCETAEPGDLSEVQPLFDPKTGEPDPGRGYQFAEFHERRPQEVPDFADREVQRILSRYIVDGRSKLAVGTAREGLWRDSFRWVNPLLSGGATAPDAARAP